MKQYTTEALGHGLIALSVSIGASNKMGWFDFINTNAGGISVLVSIFFGFIGMIFYYSTWKKSTKADDNSKRLDELEFLNRELERENTAITERKGRKNENINSKSAIEERKRER